MPNGFYGADLDTVGMELEGISINADSLAEILAMMHRNYPATTRQVSLVHDASTEFNASYIRTSAGNILVSNHTAEMQNILGGLIIGSRKMGYEIVTTPLLIPDLEAVIYPVVNTLVNNGDFLSDRAATHYHIGFPINLRMMKNLMKIALMIDPVLFRLGGMGRTFRGKINLAAYARPLMNSTAVYISGSRGKFAKIINPVAALEATSLDQFWAAFGVRFKPGGASSKYHASRYVGINFYSLPQHGTIEFRHFNQSHEPFLMMAIGKMLRGFAELATVISKQDYSVFEIVPSNQEISMSDASEIIGRLLGLCHDKELENLPSEEEVAEILQTLSKSHFEPIPETPVLTHLRDDANTISMDMVQAGSLQTVHEVLPPQFCDIHNIRYRSIFDNVNLAETPQTTSSQIPQGEIQWDNSSEEELDEEDFEDNDLEESEEE